MHCQTTTMSHLPDERTLQLLAALVSEESPNAVSRHIDDIVTQLQVVDAGYWTDEATVRAALHASAKHGRVCSVSPFHQDVWRLRHDMLLLNVGCNAGFADALGLTAPTCL